MSLYNKAKSAARVVFGKSWWRVQQFRCHVMYHVRKHTPVERYPRELEKRYLKVTGKPMDMNAPNGYSQKIQWLKLYDDNPLRTMLSDKVAVRDWIAGQIGEEYLIPIIGVYDRMEEVDFDSLPDRFVIKTNHSSGWNVIVKDKSTVNWVQVVRQVNGWLKKNYAFWSEYEIHYADIKPRILIEKYVTDHSGNLNDYKFLCFDGMPKYIWVDYDRQTNHKRNVYDMDWNLQEWSQFNYGNKLGEEVPTCFAEMKEIAAKLCQGFRHVRVDLYNVDGKVYFGEMTFTNGSGFEIIRPEPYEYMLGDLIKLPTDE